MVFAVRVQQHRPPGGQHRLKGTHYVTQRVVLAAKYSKGVLLNQTGAASHTVINIQMPCCSPTSPKNEKKPLF